MKLSVPGANALLASRLHAEELFDGAFVVRGKEWARLMSLLQIKACMIHCYDGRPFWRRINRRIAMTIEPECLLRMPLAGGVAARPEEYTDYLLGLIAEMEMEISQMVEEGFFALIMTHWKCRRLGSNTSEQTEDKGNLIYYQLLTNGIPAVLAHLEYHESDGIVPKVTDWKEIRKRNALADKVLAEIEALADEKPTDGEMNELTKMNLYVATKAVVGWPFKEECNSLAMLGATSDAMNSLDAAQGLSSGDLGEYKMFRLLFNGK